jgi:hypothetical protein
MPDVNKTITITIASAIAPDVIDAYAHEFSYQDSSTSESKSQFALRMFTEQAQANIRSTYKSYMTGVGAQEAQIQADSDSLNITVS